MQAINQDGCLNSTAVTTFCPIVIDGKDGIFSFYLLASAWWGEDGRELTRMWREKSCCCWYCVLVQYWLHTGIVVRENGMVCLKQSRSCLKLSNYISVVCLWPCCGHDIMVNHILLHICTARCVATSSLLHDSLHHRARKFTVLSDVHMLWIGMQVGWAKGDRALLLLWAVTGQPIVHATCGLWDNCWMQSKFVNVFWTLYFFTLTGNVCKCYCS